MGTSGASGAPALGQDQPTSDAAAIKPPTADAGGPTSACAVEPDTGLAGASWDVSLSRFAFGGTPTKSTAGPNTRWEGPQGSASVSLFGYAMARSNAAAPASLLPDWNTDPDLLTAHVRQYFVGMGAPECQILRTLVTASGSASGSTDGGITQGGSSQRTIHLARGLDGAIPIVDSLAWARMNNQNQTDAETFFWPMLPAATIAAARAFKSELADPTALAAYKAKLPSNARGDGEVVIHHTSIFPRTEFQTAVSWDTLQGPSPASFDRDGKPLLGPF